MNGLGLAYQFLGDARKSIIYFEQGIPTAQETKNRQAESVFLGNMGSAYGDLGEARKAIEYHEQALVIAREIGDRSGEGIDLGNLSECHYELGEIKEAIDYCEQSLSIFREIQDRRDESILLGNLGGYYIDYGNIAKSIVLCTQSIQIADEISYVQVQNGSRLRLAQAYLLQSDLVNARATIEAALQYNVPQYNHNASTLHGIIALRQGDVSAARQSFRRAISQADEILAKTPEYYEALDAKGLALCGLMLCRGDSRIAPADAIETFKKARKIAPHAGVIKSVLRLFDELVKCDEGGILKDVRKAVEGR